jgi:hypothetical protein
MSDYCGCGSVAEFRCGCGGTTCNLHALWTMPGAVAVGVRATSPVASLAADLWNELPRRLCGRCYTQTTPQVAAALAEKADVSDKELARQLLAVGAWTTPNDMLVKLSFGKETLVARGATGFWVRRDPLDAVSGLVATTGPPPQMPVYIVTRLTRRRGKFKEVYDQDSVVPAWVFQNPDREISAPHLAVGARGGNVQLASDYHLMRYQGHKKIDTGFCFSSPHDADQFTSAVRQPAPDDREPRVLSDRSASLIADALRL